MKAKQYFILVAVFGAMAFASGSHRQANNKIGNVECQYYSVGRPSRQLIKKARLRDIGSLWRD